MPSIYMYLARNNVKCGLHKEYDTGLDRFSKGFRPRHRETLPMPWPLGPDPGSYYKPTLFNTECYMVLRFLCYYNASKCI